MTSLETDSRFVDAGPLPSMQSARVSYAALTGILVAGLAIRLLLFSHGVFQGDAQTFRTWAVRLVSSPLSDFYASARSADHLPGDLWFLWGIAHLYHWLSPEMNVQSAGFLFLLKLVPAMADVGIALLLFVVARAFAGAGAGLFGTALFIFNPASIFLTASWGQWDSVSAFFMLAGIWLLLRGNPEWSLLPFTYAALIKPQLGVFVLLAALGWWCWKIRSRPDTGSPRDGVRTALGRLGLAALASIAILLAVDLPFNVGLPWLPTRWSIVERMSYALNRHQSISANAFNLWGVLGKSSNTLAISDSQTLLVGLSYQRWGEVLLGAAILTSLVLFWIRPDRSTALWASLAITFSLFMFPTRIHERYLMPAVVLAVLVSAVAPHLRWLGIALSLSYFVNLVFVYHYFNRFGFGAGAAGPGGLIPLGVSTVNVFLWCVVFIAGFVLVFDARRATERASISIDAADQPRSTSMRQALPGGTRDPVIGEWRD